MELLDFMSEIGKLKDITRTGWKIRSVKNPESVADHSFRLAVLAMAYAEKIKLDVEKCIKMALIHDVHEVYTQDIATRAKESNQTVSNKEKIEMEEEGIKKLLLKLPENIRKEMLSLWQEYHEKISKEALLVSDLDQIEMILQALAYKKEERTTEDLEEFFQTSESRIETELGRKLWNSVRKDYLRIKKQGPNNK